MANFTTNHTRAPRVGHGTERDGSSPRWPNRWRVGHARSVLLLTLPVLCLLMVDSGQAAWLRPLEGAGNFHCVIDQFSRWRPDGKLDVVLCVSVANREVTFIEEGSHLRGELLVQASLTGPDGEVVAGEKTIRLRTPNQREADAATLYQIFPVILRGVGFTAGKLVCRIEDQHRRRSGLLNVLKKRKARSEVAADWVAPPRELESAGLIVADPVFLSRAPISRWREEDPLSAKIEESVQFDYLHPIRRYGLEQDHLQLFCEVSYPAGDPGAVTANGLLLQISSKGLSFALRDTIRFDDIRRQILQRGGRTGFYYELDVNNLPPGAYRIGCGPLDSPGHGWLAEFDVIWSLSALNRHGNELRGEGYTVFFGNALDAFLAAGQAEREGMLEKFWAGLDPEPETAVNEVYVNFRRRVAHVRHQLGGFGRSGAVDPRGQVYLLLGAPDERQVETMPLNPSDLEDATVKVWDKYAPDRVGTQAKGANPAGTQGWWADERQGGIPVEPSRQAHREIAAKRRAIGRDMSFELWEYNHAGQQLFPNLYSSQTLGLRFLFVDRTGTGHYILEATNARDIGS